MKRILLTMAALLTMITGVQAQETTMTMIVTDNNGYVYRRSVSNVKDITFVDEAVHEYVDLGLPSGTLWAKTNVGANVPEDYGYFISWGETEQKDVYSWETYKWCVDSKTTLIKYCTDSDYGKLGMTDGKTVLDAEDDAAYCIWNSDWRMPRYEEIVELKESCTWTLKKINNKTVYEAKGPNGNSIVFPLVGRYSGSSYGLEGIRSYIWSSTTDGKGNALELDLFAGNPDYDNPAHVEIYGAYQYYGYSVRPVRTTTK